MGSSAGRRAKRTVIFGPSGFAQSTGTLIEPHCRRAPGLQGFQARDLAYKLGFKDKMAGEAAKIMANLAKVFIKTDASIAELPIDAPATVAWWPAERRETTFGHLLVRCVAETAQHAGHADILREGLDGQGGRDHDDVGDADTWSAYVARIQQAADEHR